MKLHIERRAMELHHLRSELNVLTLDDEPLLIIKLNSISKHFIENHINLMNLIARFGMNVYSMEFSNQRRRHRKRRRRKQLQHILRYHLKSVFYDVCAEGERPNISLRPLAIIINTDHLTSL